ncbi:MAG: Hsp33 family molecular chaperone HslO [Candidatus Methylacidiphilales bacterium]|nr:Hsp33 family molecular chaperone HslO [Candidatus Methylacidiphilales bacterium]
MPHDPAPPESSLDITTSFIRKRNALLARADFSPLFVDYYLHLADHAIRHPEPLDTRFKDFLAALLLHAASRPWNETHAWTVNLQEPLANFFATVDNAFGQIVGQIFTEDIRTSGQNLFFADLVPGSKPRRRSVVAFEGSDLLAAVECFYAQSEQRTARLFRIQDEEYALVSAQPDCDEAWLGQLDVEGLVRLEDEEELGFLEKRAYRWSCGCTQERMCEVLAPAMRASPEDLFGDGELIRFSCPRCGARHKITRETLEAHLARSKDQMKD